MLHFSVCHSAKGSGEGKAAQILIPPLSCCCLRQKFQLLSSNSNCSGLFWGLWDEQWAGWAESGIAHVPLHPWQLLGRLLAPAGLLKAQKKREAAKRQPPNGSEVPGLVLIRAVLIKNRCAFFPRSCVELFRSILELFRFDVFSAE